MKSMDTARGPRGRRRRSPHGALHPAIDEGEVRIAGGILAGRMEVNRRASLLHGYRELKRGGNLHNLEVAAGQADGYHPTLTLDADVFKWLEAVWWELAREDDAQLRALADEVSAVVLAAQAPDGYVNSWFQVEEPDRRFDDLTRGCEMYCAGHWIEAVVAKRRALGEDDVLDSGQRFATLLVDTFGPEGVEGVDGHEEIELALVELYRSTGESAYLDLARKFVDLRGTGVVGPGVFGPRYYQDHEPVRESSTITGHAVRAMYLATAAADIVLEQGDDELLAALERQWDTMVEQKMYLTGGLGSRERDEAIGEPYELPPDRAYCETCAAAALVFWNWRMLRATGDARYGDLLERAFYNAFLAGVSLDGLSYFYANPLEVREGFEAPFESEWSGETPWYISPAPEQATASRRRWFRCACCPPNVMRLLSSLEQYVATVDDEGVQLHMYAEGSVAVEIADGRVELEIQTDYPWSGVVDVTVVAAPEQPWTLTMRVPAWAAGAQAEVDGRRDEAAPGWWSATRRWSEGDVVRLTLPMAPRLTAPNPRASAIHGTVAIERGPLVYCIEQADVPGVNLADIHLDTSEPLVDRPFDGLVPGLVAVRASGFEASVDTDGFTDFGSVARATATRRTFTAIPYFAWANRGEGAMRVWLSRAD